MSAKQQGLVTEPFARSVCVGDLRPQTLGEGSGFRAWVNTMAVQGQAARVWKPADHVAVAAVHTADAEKMWQLAEEKPGLVDDKRGCGVASQRLQARGGLFPLDRLHHSSEASQVLCHPEAGPRSRSQGNAAVRKKRYC